MTTTATPTATKPHSRATQLRRCPSCNVRHRSTYLVCGPCRTEVESGLYGGTWVLDPIRRIQVWRPW